MHVPQRTTSGDQSMCTHAHHDFNGDSCQRDSSDCSVATVANFEINLKLL